MKVLGVVVEFNPYHNGHQYFIDQAKAKIKPDVTIAIISSSFTMRGDPMVIDKWEKAKISLSHGIDIVLELPFIAAVASADYFCHNAIKTLNDIKITDIAFGVELNDLDKLRKINQIINTDLYQTTIKTYLDQGLSYSTSSFRAMQELTKDPVIIEHFTLPNNTLAIGYIAALDKLSNARITTIQRISNNYFDENISDTKISSATSLRNLIVQGIDIKDQTPDIDYPYINPQISNDNLLFILRYIFNTKDINEFTNILGVNEGIENRMKSFINKVDDYDDFVQHVQTKRYTANRIKRLILHIILNVSKEYEHKYHSYLRILAMNKQGVNYINTLPKKIRKSIITTFKNHDNYIVDLELKASKLFGLINNQPTIYLQEYQVPFIEGEKNDNTSN